MPSRDRRHLTRTFSHRGRPSIHSERLFSVDLRKETNRNVVLVFGVDDESKMGKKLRERGAKAARAQAQPPNLLIIDLSDFAVLTPALSPVRRMYLAALHYSNLFTLFKN